MCFASTLSNPQKEFLNPRPPRTRTKYNPHPPRSKFNPHPPRTKSSAGSRTRPANVGTRNPRGLTRPAQDSSVQYIIVNVHIVCDVLIARSCGTLPAFAAIMLLLALDCVMQL